MKISSIPIAPEYPKETVEGLTFAGTLDKYLYVPNAEGNNIGIAQNWDKVLDRYLMDYNKRVLPLLPRNKALKNYQEQDFTRALDKLSQMHRYTPDTLEHYAYLMWVVYRAGFQHGHYADNIFWEEDGGAFGNGNAATEEQQRINTLVRTKKSFAPQEEKELFQLLTSDGVHTAGERIGLLIMMLASTRNNEACALRFEDIRPLREHPEAHCLWIYKSVKSGTNILKASGKTRNANRILPMVNVLFEFLEARKRYLETAVENGSLKLPENLCVNDLPIACRGNQYTEFCSADDLTQEGRRLLQMLQTKEINLAAVNRAMLINGLTDTAFEEKDPTTYLLRRNFGTHLYTLGLDPSAVQYFIGHDVESPQEERSFFSNEDRLFEIWEALQNHPLNTARPSPSQQAFPGHILRLKNRAEIELIFPPGAEGTYAFNAHTREPFDQIDWSVTGGAETKSEGSLQTMEREYPSVVNIHAALDHAYAPEEQQKNEQYPKIN